MSRTLALCTDQVLAGVESSIGSITLNNPDRLNAISPAMFAAIDEAVQAFATDGDVRAVVIRGAGDRAFASGADINDLSGDAAELPTGLSRLLGLPVPTVAVIHGYCMGGGLMTALSTDLRIASDDAVFAIPAARLGAGYPLAATKRLVDVVGVTAANHILLTGDRFGAQEAQAMGLLSRVIPRSDFRAAVESLTNTLVTNAPLSATASKLSIATTTGDASDTDALLAIKQCWASEEFRTRRRAFTERASEDSASPGPVEGDR